MSDATQKAQELLSDRITVIRQLEESNEQVTTLRAQIEDAERSFRDAWGAAKDAGWTLHELRKLGFKEPRQKRAPKKRARSPKVTSAPVTPGEDSTAEGDAAAV